MAKKTGRRSNGSTTTEQPDGPGAVVSPLPRDALKKVRLGQAFAEYDPILAAAGVFVETPAYLAATQADRGKYFFIGRRGMGKTAIARMITTNNRRARAIHPEIFTISNPLVEKLDFSDTKKREYRTLIAAFRRSIGDEMLSLVAKERRWSQHDLSDFPVLQREFSVATEWDFDERTLNFVREGLSALHAGDEAEWLRCNKRAKQVCAALADLSIDGQPYVLVFDRLDENWDQSDAAVSYLTAMMHAIVQINAELDWARALVFLRENVLDRVRLYDTEFSRLATGIVALDWTREKLLELIERRLNHPFNTRIKLGGPTWAAFFSEPERSRDLVMSYSQNRPRDVISFCDAAIQSALARNHLQVQFEDIEHSQRAFSLDKLKDLGDEYGENYPNLAVVLTKFRGLGSSYTLDGMQAVLARLLTDQDVKASCSSWIYSFGSAEEFARVLSEIGFVGLRQPGGEVVHFRSSGLADVAPFSVSVATEIVVHPSYVPALDMSDVIINLIDDRIELGGAIPDLDTLSGLTVGQTTERIEELREQLKTLPEGAAHASEFEELVFELVRLCFNRSLTNVQMKSRDHEGRVIRDVVASNRADAGFWEMIRNKFGATQIVWEVKNFSDLKASNFHQIQYYLGDALGKFGVLVFRGNSISDTALGHIRRGLSERGNMVLPLTQRDLDVFLRQAAKGAYKEDHISNRFDDVLRQVT